MVDQAPPSMSIPLSIAEAKGRLLALAAEQSRATPSPWPSITIPAAIGALFLGILATRRRRGIGLMGLAALAANPALRSLFVAFVGTATRRFIKARTG